MSACSKITKNRLYNACKRIFGGVEATLYLFNRSDIESYIRDAQNPNVIRGITMKSTAKGFRYEGYKKSIKPTVTGVSKEFGYSYRHAIAFLVLENGSEAKAEIEALGAGEFVAVIINKQKTHDAAIEVLGTDVGLVLTDMTRDLQDTATEGAYALTLQNEEGNEEPHLPASFAVLTEGATPVYSYDLSIAALEALITPVV
ncbi:hypothetical protein [Pedobacter sp. SYSU D00535]|uniref:hypothetical protein n=1 Tax=Pedobacter sp. SYSU D00535 TaxID=2810308 RepID=UPI001A9579C7|nr:hypothetical protein [Pedobacter sp. SYSU D00535]